MPTCHPTKLASAPPSPLKRWKYVFENTESNTLATEVDDQQMTALVHILCTNPHGTGDAIRAYLTLASEAADQLVDNIYIHLYSHHPSLQKR